MTQQSGSGVSRRRLLFVAAPLVLIPSTVSKLAKAAIPGERSLAFVNLHTGEKLQTVYRESGSYVDDGLAEINHILRDWRTEEVAPIDARLLDLLYELRQTMESRRPFHVISGYRSPKTNARLASKSGGVAKKSLHMQGKAIDIALPGHELKSLWWAAKGLQGGGVGFYPRSGFIHMDTGRVRYW